MTAQIQLNDLDLAALLSSRICHDVISPVGAISNGLEVLDEEHDEKVRAYALDLIRKSADQASAKLQFARLAFGAGGSVGTEIGLRSAAEIARGILDESKHQLIWQTDLESLPKDKVKLLLNLVAIAVTTLPRGGSIRVTVTGEAQRPMISLATQGSGARIPDGLPELLTGRYTNGLDTLSIQPYYASRIAVESGMSLEASMSGDTIILSARPT